MKPILMIVDSKLNELELIQEELRKRYGDDYTIIGVEVAKLGPSATPLS